MMNDEDQYFKLLHFLDKRTLTLIIKPCYIDRFINLLDWKLYSRLIEINQVKKYKHLIHWDIYLSTPKYKNPYVLFKCKSYIEPYYSLFFSNSIKKQYYDIDFINLFTNIIDWEWCLINVKLDEDTILKYWDKFNISLFSEHQILTKKIISEKKYIINWKLASKKIHYDLIPIASYLIDWNIYCEYNLIPIEIIEQYVDVLPFNKLAQYQILSESFITKYMNKLDMKLVSQYQNISYSFIKKYIDKLSLEHLSKNLIIKTYVYNFRNKWFITEADGFINFR
jgi:hypothetical protein